MEQRAERGGGGRDRHKERTARGGWLRSGRHRNGKGGGASVEWKVLGYVRTVVKVDCWLTLSAHLQ